MFTQLEQKQERIKETGVLYQIIKQEAQPSVLGLDTTPIANSVKSLKTSLFIYPFLHDFMYISSYFGLENVMRNLAETV